MLESLKRIVVEEVKDFVSKLSHKNIAIEISTSNVTRDTFELLVRCDFNVAHEAIFAHIEELDLVVRIESNFSEDVNEFQKLHMFEIKVYA